MECFKLYEMRMAEIDIIMNFLQEWFLFSAGFKQKTIKLVRGVVVIVAFLCFCMLERQIFVTKCS